jgi:hypothetical protein
MENKDKVISVVYDTRKPMCKQLSFNSARSSDVYAIMNLRDKTVNRSKVKPSGLSFAVMFSGGYDSTALVLRHLERGDCVYPYFVGFQTDSAIGYQYKMADLEILAIQSFYGHELCKSLWCTVDCVGFSGMRSALIQQPILALIASTIAVPKNVHFTAVEIGFCMKDCAISFMTELKTIYNANCKINYKREIPLKFPLYQTSHDENIDYCNEFESTNNVDLPIHSSEKFKVSYYKSKENQKHVKMFVEFNNSTNGDNGTPKPDIHSNMLIEGNKNVILPSKYTILRCTLI